MNYKNYLNLRQGIQSKTLLLSEQSVQVFTLSRVYEIVPYRKLLILRPSGTCFGSFLIVPLYKRFCSFAQVANS